MPKKPRTKFQPLQETRPRLVFRPGHVREVLHQEFHNCDYLGCRNIISNACIPHGQAGPVYCTLHRDPVNPG